MSNTNQKDSDRDGIGDACDDPSTEKEKKVGSRVLREQTLNFIEVARSFKGQNLQRYAIRVLSLFAPLIERAMSNRTARNLEKIKSLQEDLERATQRHPLSKKDYRRLLKRTKNKLEIKVEKEK